MNLCPFEAYEDRIKELELRLARANETIGELALELSSKAHELAEMLREGGDCQCHHES